MSSVEEKLGDAARDGLVEEVLSLLRDNPGLNVNWGDSDQYTALHSASLRGHVEAAKVLLAHPDINVNCKASDGETPVLLGCLSGRVPIIRLMLKDPRVDVTVADNMGCTPLWWVSFWGKHEVVEWLMASGRDLEVIINLKGKGFDGRESIPLEIARGMGKSEVASLLERFIDNPTQTRRAIRVKLGVLDEQAAEVFALTVFICDGLLQLKPASSTTTSLPAARFFTIATRLPMELQMILCHRAVGSMRQNVLHQDSEAAFKSLARLLSFES